jgi:hypothetical protein
LLANHRQSIKDFIVMPEGSRNYIPKPEGWISFAELERDSSETPVALAEKESLSSVVPVLDQHPAPSSSSTSSKISECEDNIDSYTNESSDPSESSDVPKSERKKASLGIEQAALTHQRESDSLEESLDRAEPIPVEGLERGGMILETTGKIDQRKFNRGQAKRKSYE